MLIMKYLIAIYLPIVKINLNYFVKEIFHSQMRKKNIFLYHRQINQYEFLKRIYYSKFSSKIHIDLFADDTKIYFPIGRSLIYNKNKIGPKTDPCGTPDFTIELFEKEFSTRVI